MPNVVKIGRAPAEDIWRDLDETANKSYKTATQFVTKTQLKSYETANEKVIKPS